MSGTKEVSGVGPNRRSNIAVGEHRWVAAGAVLFLIVLALLFFVASSSAVVGPSGNYSESNGDIVEICSDAACATHTTTFNPGDTVYVRVTTTRVSANSGNSRLRLRRFQNTNISVSNWTQTSLTSPYVYTTSLVIPAGQTEAVKLWGKVRNGNSGPRVQFEEELSLNGVNQYMKLYSDAAMTDESYTFAPGATIFVRTWGRGVAYDAARTGNNQQQVRSFDNSSITAWPAPVVTQAGNWYDFQLTLPAGGFTDGDWYWLQTRLRPASGGDIARLSSMVQIDATAPTATITAPLPLAYVAGNLSIDGTADDTISFNSYMLEYGAGAAPATWTQIGSTAYTPVVASTLGSWDTTTVSDGLYTLRLTVLDRAYNTSTATVQVNVDNNAPVISAVAASGITSTGATVTWTTNEPADSQVEYGTSTGVYTDSTVLDATMVTSHSQALAGLQPSTTYYYRVRSADAAGYVTYSSEYSFKTANITILQLSPGLGMDSQIRSNQPSWNLGADAALMSGDVNAVDLGTVRSMLQFDMSGIPGTAVVNNATMALYQNWQGDTSTPNLDVHYLTQGWTEGTGTGSATGDGITWFAYDGIGLWAMPGGDFNAVASASTVAPNSTASWVTWDLGVLSQAWIDGTVTNNGLVLKQDVEDPAGSDAKGFHSLNYATDATLRPILVVEWLGDDVTGPTIGDVRAENVSRTTADIKWSTGEAATTQVEYGTTTSYGSTTPLDSTLVNQHSVPLAGLTENTLYHFRVRSIDPSGNEAISGDYTFNTAVLLVIQPGPVAGKDATIALGQPTANSGAWILHLTGDNSAPAWQSIRTAAQFDLSAIPTGSTVNSATMSFYQWWQGDPSTPTMDLHYLTGNWAEGTGTMTATGDGATWNTFDGVNPWTTPGGDYNATASASAVAPNSTASWVDWNVSGLTQDWVDGIVNNNGIIIKKNLENPLLFDAKAFHSAEYMVDPTLRPKMVIEYIPAPGSITMTVDETFNRDGSGGGGSVGFGTLNVGSTYTVGDTASPQYAVKMTVQTNANWGFKVSAADDLVHSVTPANTIAIANLLWKIDGGGGYAPFVKAPAEATILSAQAPTSGTSLMYDYRLVVPGVAVSGSYSTQIAYTAYTE